MHTITVKAGAICDSDRSLGFHFETLHSWVANSLLILL
ncbi:unnamed protein product [Acidithrix sp. C25]|nr:unnamed protein product [Acidithrix sp. C25]